MINISSSLSQAPRIRQELKDTYDADIGRCYQCGKCSAGCPVSFAMDNPPHKVVQMARLGMETELLESRSVWLCASCDTCSARCPRDVHPSRVMEGVRIEALKSGRAGVRPVNVFHTKFLDLVKRYGRVHEMGLILWSNILTGRFTKDAHFAPKLVVNGKLSLSAHSTAEARNAVRDIFERCSNLDDAARSSSSTGTPIDSDEPANSDDHLSGGEDK